VPLFTIFWVLGQARLGIVHVDQEPSIVKSSPNITHIRLLGKHSSLKMSWALLVWRNFLTKKNWVILSFGCKIESNYCQFSLCLSHLKVPQKHLCIILKGVARIIFDALIVSLLINRAPWYRASHNVALKVTVALYCPCWQIGWWVWWHKIACQWRGRLYG
jgi:hypothetical protein